MADYKVGNLQIVFDTLNQTDEGFKKLASNLRAVQKAIAKIGDTDLKPFVANIKQITKSFTPLLTNISGASEGIIALNQAIQKIGASKLSKVSQEFSKITTVAEETAKNGIKDLGAAIKETEERLATFTSKTSKSFTDLNQELLYQQQYLKQLNRAYAQAFNKNRETDIEAYGDKIIETKQAIQELKDQIKELNKQPIEDIFTPFNDAQKEVAKLTNELLNLTYASGQVDSGIANSIRELNSQINTTQEAVKKATMSEEELTIYEYRNIEATRKQRIEFLEASLALGKAGENAEAYKQELAELTGEQEKNNKATKKSTSGFSKFLASLKRIALYRLIRSALKAITSSLTETAKAFAQVDDGVNDTMSQLTSSLSIIKLSFGATLLPILQMITPIVQEIGIAFANVANMVSQAMSTTGTYTKINTELIKKYRDELEQTGSLLDFDKFRSLNQKGGGLSDFLIPDQEVDKKNEKIIKLRKTIQTITNIISELWSVIKSGWSAISPFVETALEIISNTVLPALQDVFDYMGKVVKKIDELGLTKPIIYGIISAITALGASKLINGISKLTSSFNLLNIAIGAVLLSVALIANWDSFSREAKKTITVVSSLIAVFTGLAVAILSAQSALTLGTGTALILTAAAAGAVAIRGLIGEAQSQLNGNGVGGIAFKADGGSVPVGSLFWAGEAGAETVTVGSSGRTEVTNVNQMETALYNALVRYGRENRGSDSAININIDGQKVFEATRRTANKRGLDFSRV